MHTLSKKVAKIISGLVFGIFIASVAHAQVVPEPVHPMKMVNMPFDQRLSQIKERHAMLLKSTPQQRQAYHQKQDSMLAAMSPADKEALRNKIKANRAAMTPEQKAAIRTQNQSYFDALPANEREAMKANQAKLKKG